MAVQGKSVACLTLNLVLPGLGSLLIRKFACGLMQTLISSVATGFLVWALISIYGQMRGVISTDSLEDVSWGQLTAPLVALVIGIILFKVSWIWAQFTTARHLRAGRAGDPPSINRDRNTAKPMA